MMLWGTAFIVNFFTYYVQIKAKKNKSMALQSSNLFLVVFRTKVALSWQPPVIPSLEEWCVCVRTSPGCSPCRSSDRPVQSAWAQAGRGQGICGLHRIPGWVQWTYNVEILDPLTWVCLPQLLKQAWVLVGQSWSAVDQKGDPDVAWNPSHEAVSV